MWKDSHPYSSLLEPYPKARASRLLLSPNPNPKSRPHLKPGKKRSRVEMPSLDEEERAVFDDVFDDVDDSDSDSDDEDDDEDFHEVSVSGVATAPQQPPALPPSALEAVGDANANPNPDPNLHASSDPSVLPQNGASGELVLYSGALEEDEEAARQQQALEERQRAFEESRRLFQRLWTEEDELVILQGFYEFVSGRGTVHASHQHDTGPFYDQIRARLQLDFTKNQLIEKLRRLKKKFRNVVSRMTSAGPGDFAFKSSHEKATFEIARKIWSSHLKRGRDFMDDEDLLNLPIIAGDSTDNLVDGVADAVICTRSRRRRRKRFASAEAVAAAAAAPVRTVFDHSVSAAPVSETNHVNASPAAATAQVLNANVVEETVRSCLSPFFKELLNSVLNGPCRPAIGDAGLGLNLMPQGFGGSPGGRGVVNEEKWKKQQILELEVYAKRIELVQDQIKLTLEELRSMGS